MKQTNDNSAVTYEEKRTKDSGGVRMMFTAKEIATVDRILIGMGKPSSVVENPGTEDEYLIILGYLSLSKEERELSTLTIGGTRVENRIVYVLSAEYVERNYPSEPDWSDIVEVDANTSLYTIMGEALKLEFMQQVENVLEGVGLQDFYEEERDGNFHY